MIDHSIPPEPFMAIVHSRKEHCKIICRHDKHNINPKYHTCNNVFEAER